MASVSRLISKTASSMTCKALVTSFTLLGSETCWRQPDLEDQRPAHALDAMAWVIGLPEHPQIERERRANVLQQGFGIGLQGQPGDKALDARVSAMGSRRPGASMGRRGLLRTTSALIHPASRVRLPGGGSP